MQGIYAAIAVCGLMPIRPQDNQIVALETRGAWLNIDGYITDHETLFACLLDAAILTLAIVTKPQVRQMAHPAGRPMHFECVAMQDHGSIGPNHE
jgi:hypothetical protein